MLKISEMDDDTAAAFLLKAYRGACDAYRGFDEHGAHPGVQVNRWIRIAASGGTNSEKEIEGQDDDQPEVSGGNAGATPAQDAALQIEEYRILNSGHHDVAGALALHRAKQSDPRKVRAMASAIAGYDTRK